MDVSAPVLIMTRFQKSPNGYYHRAAKRVLRYLRVTKKTGLKYFSEQPVLNKFVDADYAGDTIDRNSMYGYMIKLGDVTCIWGSRKQATIALSTCESEYYSWTLEAQETVWIIRVLEEIGICVQKTFSIWSDHQSAIAWATAESCTYDRAENIDVRVQFIRELVADSDINVKYGPSEKDDADMLTNPLGPTSLSRVIKKVGLGGAIEEEC